MMNASIVICNQKPKKQNIIISNKPFFHDRTAKPISVHLTSRPFLPPKSISFDAKLRKKETKWERRNQGERERERSYPMARSVRAQARVPVALVEGKVLLPAWLTWLNPEMAEASPTVAAIKANTTKNPVAVFPIGKYIGEKFGGKTTTPLPVWFADVVPTSKWWSMALLTAQPPMPRTMAYMQKLRYRSTWATVFRFAICNVCSGVSQYVATPTPIKAYNGQDFLFGFFSCNIVCSKAFMWGYKGYYDALCSRQEQQNTANSLSFLLRK